MLRDEEFVDIVRHPTIDRRTLPSQKSIASNESCKKIASNQKSIQKAKNGIIMENQRSLNRLTKGRGFAFFPPSFNFLGELRSYESRDLSILHESSRGCNLRRLLLLSALPPISAALQPQVALVDSQNRPVPAKVTNNGDNTHRVDYTPQLEGPMTANVAVAGKPVPRSPFKVNCGVKSKEN